jgi:hypothetical protein
LLFFAMCAGALALRLPPAAGDDGAVDAPSGTVAFFSGVAGVCPQGWRVATEAAGRLLIGVQAADSVGKFVGTPLTNEEDRTHAHSFLATVALPYKSISAADGSNDQGAAAQTYTDSGMTQPASTGLPFIQLVACVKL